MKLFNYDLPSFVEARAFNQEYKVGDEMLVQSIHGHMLWGILERPVVAMGNRVFINLEGYSLCFHLEQVIGKA